MRLFDSVKSALAWALYWAGDLAERCGCAALYRRLMNLAARAQGDGKGAVAMRRRLLFLPVVLLTLPAAMCQTTRYVPVACVTDAQYEELRKAEPPKVGDQLTGKADHDIRPIAGSALRLRAWGRGLLGVLEGCRASEARP